MKNIFVIITEHHVAMALAIIHQEKLNNNVILFSSQTRNTCNEKFFREIESSNIDFNVDFVSVDEKMPSKFIFYKTLWKRIYFRRVYRKIRETLGRNSKNSKFFIFADHDPVTQFVINEFPDQEFNLVQDGFAQYAEFKHSNRHAKNKQWYYRWMFGDFWRPISHFGDYYQYSSLYVLYPEMVEQRYKSLNLKKVSMESFYGPNWLKFSRRFILNEFPEFFHLKNEDAMMFLPRLKNGREINLVKNKLSEMCRKHKIQRLCLKNHPRSKFRLCKVDFVESYEVPSALPAECLFAFNNEIAVRYFVPLSTLVIVGTYKARRNQINILFGNKLAATNLKIRENEVLYGFLKEKTVFYDY